MLPFSQSLKKYVLAESSLKLIPKQKRLLIGSFSPCLKIWNPACPLSSWQWDSPLFKKILISVAWRLQWSSLNTDYFRLHILLGSRSLSSDKSYSCRLILLIHMQRTGIHLSTIIFACILFSHVKCIVTSLSLEDRLPLFAIFKDEEFRGKCDLLKATHWVCHRDKLWIKNPGPYPMDHTPNDKVSSLQQLFYYSSQSCTKLLKYFDEPSPSWIPNWKARTKMKVAKILLYFCWNRKTLYQTEGWKMMLSFSPERTVKWVLLPNVLTPTYF